MIWCWCVFHVLQTQCTFSSFMPDGVSWQLPCWKSSARCVLARTWWLSIRPSTFRPPGAHRSFLSFISNDFSMFILARSWAYHFTHCEVFISISSSEPKSRRVLFQSWVNYSVVVSVVARTRTSHSLSSLKIIISLWSTDFASWDILERASQRISTWAWIVLIRSEGRLSLKTKDIAYLT